MACLVLRNLPANQALGAVYQDYLYRLTPFRLDGLFGGAAVALAYRDAQMRAWVSKRMVPAAIAAMMLFLATVAAAKMYPESGAMTRVGYSLLALGFSALIAHSAFAGGGIAGAWFRSPFMRAFGKYSYFIYVIHVSIFGLLLIPLRLMIGGGQPAALVSGIICVGVMFWLAVVSWFAFESRVLALAAGGSSPKSSVPELKRSAVAASATR